MASRQFLLDANVLITAARDHYPFDLAPKLWVALAQRAREGTICSIDRVQDELMRGNQQYPDDELLKWLQADFAGAFQSTNAEAVMQAYAQVIQWAQGQPQFTNAAKAEFAACADGWLVAYAKANGCVLVTLERYSRDARKRVLIPNACKAMSVVYVDTLTMLRELGVCLS